MSKIIITDDGSSTLFLDEYEQAMHSTSGAFQESMLKHVIPSRILEKEEKELHVLDIGFGLGYNVLAVMCGFIEHEKNSLLTVISLEKERAFSEYLDSMRFNDERDDLYEVVKKSYVNGAAEYKNIRLQTIFGDARLSLKYLEKDRFHAVFQDPFSPAKNPELWSVEYFKLLYFRMRDDGILTTYSSADHIRMAMIKAGFYIGKGPSVGKKREGTIAAKKEIIIPLEEERISAIKKNLKSEPFHDTSLLLSREKIIKNRAEEIRKKKIFIT